MLFHFIQPLEPETCVRNANVISHGFSKFGFAVVNLYRYAAGRREAPIKVSQRQRNDDSVMGLTRRSPLECTVGLGLARTHASSHRFSLRTHSPLHRSLLLTRCLSAQALLHSSLLTRVVYPFQALVVLCCVSRGPCRAACKGAGMILCKTCRGTGFK